MSFTVCLVDDDLFSQAARDRLLHTSPLPNRMRPTSLDEIVGQRHLVSPTSAFRRLVEADRLSSVILYGPPGTGKTTLAEVVALHTRRAFFRLSATSSGVKEIRDVTSQANERLKLNDGRTVLFLDEIHRFSRSQQDALLPSVESGLITLIGATTENPFHAVNPALRSRSTLFRLNPLEADDILSLLNRGLDVLHALADHDALDLIAERSLGDARQALVSLEVSAAIARGEDAPRITLAHATSAISTSALRYGRDDHYDVVSAFIKSIRGSDPDAAMHYLARMLEAGEDPTFICRRLVILASEDIGLAQPSALSVAVAASHALALVGLPEAALNIAHAVVYLAKSKKSDAVARALHAAVGDIRAGKVYDVPPHLRDTHYEGASSLGYAGYVSPHDDPAHQQTYLPDGLAGTKYLTDGS